MTALRALSYLAVAAAVWVAPGGFELDDADSAIVAIVLLAVFALFDLTLAGGVYRGWNWSRLLVCASSLLSAGSVFIARLESGQGDVKLPELPSLGISVLVLLALSSEAARRFCIRELDIPDE